MALGGTALLGILILQFVSATMSRAQTYTLTTLAHVGGYGGVTLDGKGNLYGTQFNNGVGDGTVYEVAAGTNAVTTLANLGFGANPYGNLVFDKNGDIFGTTSGGGANNKGFVFEIAAGTNTLTTIPFGGANGWNAQGGLTLDSNGNLYGTTYSGGGLLVAVQAMARYSRSPLAQIP